MSDSELPNHSSTRIGKQSVCSEMTPSCSDTASHQFGEEQNTELREFVSQVMMEVNNAYNLEHQKPRYTPHWLVDSIPFTLGVGLFIVANTMQMGLEVEFPEYKSLWIICENVFTSVFLIEMGIKIACLKWRYFEDSANWLDGIIVVVSLVDCWVLDAVFAGKDSSLPAFSFLRMIRLVRLIRILRLVKRLRPLVMVIRAVLTAITTTFWTACVVLLTVYVGGIVCTEYIGRGNDARLYPGYATDNDQIDHQELMANFNPHVSFGSLPKSMFTLFSIAIMSEWSEVVRPITIKQPFFCIFFIAFTMFTVFGVMNVMVGLIVDNVFKETSRLESEESEREKTKKLSCLSDVRKLIFSIDKNGDGLIGVKELESCWDGDVGATIHAMLDKLKVPAGLTAAELNYMLDNDGDGHLYYNEFIKSFYRLIESTEFQQICIIQIGVNQLKNMINHLTHCVEKLAFGVGSEVAGGRSDRVKHGVNEISNAQLAALITESQRSTEQKLKGLELGLQRIAQQGSHHSPCVGACVVQARHEEQDTMIHATDKTCVQSVVDSAHQPVASHNFAAAPSTSSSSSSDSHEHPREHDDFHNFYQGFKGCDAQSDSIPMVQALTGQLTNHSITEKPFVQPAVDHFHRVLLPHTHSECAGDVRPKQHFQNPSDRLERDHQHDGSNRLAQACDGKHPLSDRPEMSPTQFLSGYTHEARPKQSVSSPYASGDVRVAQTCNGSTHVARPKQDALSPADVEVLVHGRLHVASDSERR